MNVIITPQIHNQIVNYINDGYKPYQIAKFLNLNRITVDSHIRVKCGNPKFKPNKGNVHYFHTIDSYAKAYIVGFIAADGSLVESKTTTTLTITIHRKDLTLLEFIKSEIGNSHEIKSIRRPCGYNQNKIIDHVRYAISDKNITQDLNNLGIYSRKSLTIGKIIYNIPQQFRDAFIIGYFDGNGSVSLGKEKVKPSSGKLYPSHALHISFRSTKEFLEGICEHLNISKNRIHFYDSIYTLSFSHKRDVCRLFKCYNNLPFYLNRKYDKFLEKINHHSYDKYK